MQKEDIEGNPAGEQGLSRAAFVIQAGGKCLCLEMQQRFAAGFRDLLAKCAHPALPQAAKTGAQCQP